MRHNRAFENTCGARLASPDTTDSNANDPFREALWAGLTVLGLQLAVAAWGGAAGGVKSDQPRLEGITEYHLANGLRVLLYPDLSKPTSP